MALKKILQVQRLIGLSDRDIPSLQQRFGKNIFKTSYEPSEIKIEPRKKNPERRRYMLRNHA